MHFIDLYKILIEQGHVSPYMEINGECILDYPVVLEKLDIVDYLCNEKGCHLIGVLPYMEKTTIELCLIYSKIKIILQNTSSINCGKNY